MSAQLVGTCGHVGCSARGNVGTDARFSEEARAGLRVRQVGAYLDVVLFGDEQWVSLLAFQSAVPRKWTVAEEGLFREVGERVKSAIERARTEEQVRELNETLETRVAGRTADLARTWNNSRDLLTILGAEGVLRAASPAWLSIWATRKRKSSVATSATSSTPTTCNQRNSR